MKRISKYTNELILLLSSIGFVDAFYLTQKHYSEGPVTCPIFGGCDTVTNSVYSEIFGIPVSLLGSLYYASLFTLIVYSYITNNKKATLLATQFSIAGFTLTTYFLYIMVYVLQAICFYCLVSAITSTTIFTISLIYLRKQKGYLLEPFYSYIFSLTKRDWLWGLSRISLGFIFLWAFLAKLPAWISGTSPTTGFLGNATTGVLSQFFSGLSGNGIVDHMYMWGLMLVGIALIFGISMKLATIGGSLMMLLIYLSVSLPPEHNPLIDEHIIYILLLNLIYINNAGESIGLQKYWRKLSSVQALPIFK